MSTQPPATPSWANKTVCLRAGTPVPINSNREQQRKPSVYFHSSSFKATCPYGWLSVYITGKERGQPTAYNNNNLTERRHRLESLQFVYSARQHNQRTIYPGNRKKKPLKKQPCRIFNVIFLLLKGPWCCDCHMPLAIEFSFFLFFFNCRMSHLIECQTSLIEEAKSI